MEMTRLQWSKSFGCDKPKRDLRLVGGIVAAFVILIVVFYGGVYFYGYLEEKKEKRIYSGKRKNLMVIIFRSPIVNILTA